MQTKKRFTPEQKVIILRAFESKLSISQVAEKYGIHVNDIYAWKKKLFENATEIFANTPDKPAKTEESSYSSSNRSYANGMKPFHSFFEGTQK